MMNERDVNRTVYDKSAKQLATYYSRYPGYRSEIANLVKMIGTNNPKVVELGCGAGRDATDILSHTNDYVGVDISSGMLEVARSTHPGVTFVEGDAATFPIPEGTDIIFSFATILHLPKDDVRTLFSNAASSLNRGGIVFISTKLGDYRREEKMNQYGTRVFYYYDPNLLQELAGPAYRMIEQSHKLIGHTDWINVGFQKV